MCWTAVSTTARDWVISPTAAVAAGLHGLRGGGDTVIGGNHGRCRGFLQLSGPVGLARKPAPLPPCLQIAGDVGELDAEAADPVGELIDQPFAG